jgi:hypothetical protein
MCCAVILGFIGSHHVEAITSLCRFWHMDETGYHQLLHFCHASAWCLYALVTHWNRLVLAQHVAVMGQGRTVLVGDHTYVVKDARRMLSSIDSRRLATGMLHAHRGERHRRGAPLAAATTRDVRG